MTNKGYWAATLKDGELGIPDHKAEYSDQLISVIADQYVDELGDREDPSWTGFPGLMAVYKSMVGDDLVQLDKSIVQALEIEIEEEILSKEKKIRSAIAILRKKQAEIERMAKEKEEEAPYRNDVN